MSRRDNGCRIYVGNLPPDVRVKDIDDLFYKFGKIIFTDLKNGKGTPFAFVEFEDPRDAEDAVMSRDRYDFDGYKLRVEFPHNSSNSSSRRGGAGNNFRTGRDFGGGSRSSATRRSQYRVAVSGLPNSGSWQDLKDHMREAGEVCFADVFKDGTGVVEFIRYEDMRYAVKKLDDSKFRSHEGENSYIRVMEEYSGARRYRSRSPRSPSGYRGSPSYSPVRRSFSRSYSRSRSSSRHRY